MRFKKSILGAALAAVASTAVLGSAIAQNTVVPGDPGATVNTPAPAARPESRPAPARADGERRHARADTPCRPGRKRAPKRSFIS